MKTKIMILSLGLFLSGCGSCHPQNQPILAKINNYEITKDEFEQEFKNSQYAAQDTLESRKEFLSTLIDRKLILQQAQAEGLDKNKAFLKAIERFWEQSLLKVYLDKKTKELSSAGRMNDWLTQLRVKAQITVNENLLTGRNS